MRRAGKSGRWNRRRFDHGQPIRFLSFAPLAGTWMIAAALCMGVHDRSPHAVLIDLPLPFPEEADTRLGLPIDRLALDRAGAIFWNSQQISFDELERHLAARRADQTQQGAFGLYFDPAPDAAYGVAARVLAAIKRTGNADVGFCFDRLASYRVFEQAYRASTGPIPARERCDPARDPRLLKPLPPLSAERPGR